MKEKYISALRYESLTSFYDSIMQWTMREKTFKHKLVEQADLQPDQRVLDLGCGTATLTIMLKQVQPAAHIVGLDGDKKALEIARQKIANNGSEIELQEGMSFETGLPDNSFDRVVSSLLFHHLTPSNKQRTFAEVFRILKPGGELHIADWGKPTNVLMHGSFFIVQLLDGFETTMENMQGKLPDYIQHAGFSGVEEPARLNTMFGSLCLYQGIKP